MSIKSTILDIPDTDYCIEIIFGDIQGISLWKGDEFIDNFESVDDALGWVKEEAT